MKLAILRINQADMLHQVWRRILDVVFGSLRLHFRKVFKSLACCSRVSDDLDKSREERTPISRAMLERVFRMVQVVVCIVARTVW
jgi:hypothetical protein